MTWDLYDDPRPFEQTSTVYGDGWEITNTAQVLHFRPYERDIRDPAWKYVDAEGHKHTTAKPNVKPVWDWIYWDEYDSERVIDHYVCQRCTEVITIPTVKEQVPASSQVLSRSLCVKVTFHNGQHIETWEYHPYASGALDLLLAGETDWKAVTHQRVVDWLNAMDVEPQIREVRSS